VTAVRTAAATATGMTNGGPRDNELYHLDFALGFGAGRRLCLFDKPNPPAMRIRSGDYGSWPWSHLTSYGCPNAGRSRTTLAKPNTLAACASSTAAAKAVPEQLYGP
jgi:hypothetical protein